MSTPARYDLAIYRGDSEAWTFSLWTDADATVPMDLTGITARAEIRAKPGAPDVLALLTCTVELPNIVRVDLAADVSATLPTCSGSWDLELATAERATVRTVVAGRAVVTADVAAAPPVPDLVEVLT